MNPFFKKPSQNTAFISMAFTAMLLFLLIIPDGAFAQSKANAFYVPLCDDTRINIEGPHRFIDVNGRCGYHPLSIRTKATIEPEIHKGKTGTLSFWFSPLEDMRFYMNPKIGDPPTIALRDFSLVSDVPMHNKSAAISYGIYWTAGYPQLMGKFKSGAVWDVLDYGLAPFVYGEAVPMRKGYWYHVALTWNKKENNLKLYVNGILAGYNHQAENFDPVPDKLYVGNTMMVMKDLKFTSDRTQEDQLRNIYAANKPQGKEKADQDIKTNFLVQPKPDFTMKRDNSWEKVYSCSFTNPEDLDSWIFQAGEKYRDQFELSTSDEGLLIKTPDIIAQETRMYLWSPRTFEGDQWIEFDFQVLSDEGLALLVACASGYQREDFIKEYGVTKTGNMGFILNDIRNYHWEFMRRVELMRHDISSNYVAKNPWYWRMHFSTFPRLENGKWYRLRFIKMGHRLIGSIDGKKVFDIKDDPAVNNGPVLNYGRIGIRQMYQTSMRYKNLVVYEKKKK